LELFFLGEFRGDVSGFAGRGWIVVCSSLGRKRG
jgi:hypothetical protein